MSNTIKLNYKVFNYKGYNIPIHRSDEDNCYWGKLEILGIDEVSDKIKSDLILMEGNTLTEFIEDAKNAIDHYIEICKD